MPGRPLRIYRRSGFSIAVIAYTLRSLWSKIWVPRMLAHGRTSARNTIIMGLLIMWLHHNNGICTATIADAIWGPLCIVKIRHKWPFSSNHRPARRLEAVLYTDDAIRHLSIRRQLHVHRRCSKVLLSVAVPKRRQGWRLLVGRMDCSDTVEQQWCLIGNEAHLSAVCPSRTASPRPAAVYPWIRRLQTQTPSLWLSQVARGTVFCHAGVDRRMKPTRSSRINTRQLMHCRTLRDRTDSLSLLIRWSECTNSLTTSNSE